MATKIVMEALSPTMEEGRLVAWRKREGDAVRAGDTLAEVETDKAVMELIARGDGVLRRIVLGEGTTVPVGAVVGVIGTADEDISAIAGPGAAAAAIPAGGPGGSTAGAADVAAPGAAAGATPGTAPLAAPHGFAGRTARSARTAPDAAVEDRSVAAPAGPVAAAPAGRIFASPLARRMASERGLDLRTVAGTGPGGRVVRRDVEAAPAAGEPVRPASPGAVRAQRAVRPGEPPEPAIPAAGGAAAAAFTAPAVPAAPAGGYTDVPLTQIRKTIAKRLAQSLGPIPHFFLTREIDMERAAEARAHLKALGDAYAVSYNDLVIKAAALALRKHPAVNASFLDDRVRYHGDVHIGMAVAVDDGLITPVIRHADRKGLAEIAGESKLLAEKARARRLTPEEYTGSTFSVSNLGMLDIDEFTAVINPPEAAILAVGRVTERAVVVDGAVVARRLLRVTLSCDHRVVDGATGARFLQTLTLMLENPLAMLL
jgi:pyruvate dehydrogenase E2 component (dihydrolipoamide acetyltransferase)